MVYFLPGDGSKDPTLSSGRVSDPRSHHVVFFYCSLLCSQCLMKLTLRLVFVSQVDSRARRRGSGPTSGAGAGSRSDLQQPLRRSVPWTRRAAQWGHTPTHTFTGLTAHTHSVLLYTKTSSDNIIDHCLPMFFLPEFSSFHFFFLQKVFSSFICFLFLWRGKKPFE